MSTFAPTNFESVILILVLDDVKDGLILIIGDLVVDIAV